MADYIYKGFKVHYNIKKRSQSDTTLYTAKGSYTAEGSATRKDGTQLIPQIFETEAPTKIGVQNEIKKLIERTIDLEVQEYIDMQGER